MDILTEYRDAKAAVQSAKKKKSFTEASENLIVGADVIIMRETAIPDGSINSIATKVMAVKDTLFEAGDYKFYKEIEEIMDDGSTRHRCYGKDNKDITVIVRG